jgi:pyruvate dehydrogenase E2 component (dihydrolipoamide acetyltransferase)
VLAKPPVRKLAKDLGVDLATLAGSGPGGVITREDVTAANMRAEPLEAPATMRAESVEDLATMRAEPVEVRQELREDVRIPIKGVRKSTADAMVRSAFTAPHVTVWLDCDVTGTMQLVERLRARREFADLRISPLLVIAKAVCLALGRTPELNSFWDEPTQHIVLKKSINLGIATATARGLLVPNIKGAEALGLTQLAAALNEAVAVARDGRTQPAQMAGGTFTITNIGVFGVDAGAPILNPGSPASCASVRSLASPG